jgi:hypothetical protein
LLRGRSDERITLSASLADSLIHERCDAVIVVTSHELGDRASVEFAPRSLEPRGEPLGVLEHVIGYRNSSFHTESMTTQKGRVKVGDGAIPGRCQVFFTVEKSFAGRERLVPARYASAEETPFAVTVESRSNPPFRFEIE